MAQGVVKVYDPTTGVGVIVSDADHSEVLLRPGSLKGSLFRTLRQGQRIVFQVETDAGQSFAHSIGFGADGH
jgi:CspA family cold shock protein